VPQVLRARGFRLYTDAGKRLVDLWQAGGEAILGHTPASVMRSFKNAAERGLFAPFPHPLEAGFFKALSLILPGYVFRVYTDAYSLRRALRCAAGFPGDAPFLDPACHPPSVTVRAALTPAVSLWRPFLPPPRLPVLVPVLPFPCSPKVLAFRQGFPPSDAIPPVPLPPEAPGPIRDLPPSDAIPPVLLAGVTRSIYDLIAAKERGSVRFPKIDKAFEESGEQERQVSWQRQGIYLHYTRPANDDASEIVYEVVFNRFLKAGFLLPPHPELPAILPAVLSDGEQAKLAQLL
jgi:hypothetical protein